MDMAGLMNNTSALNSTVINMILTMTNKDSIARIFKKTKLNHSKRYMIFLLYLKSVGILPGEDWPLNMVVKIA